MESKKKNINFRIAPYPKLRKIVHSSYLDIIAVVIILATSFSLGYHKTFYQEGPIFQLEYNTLSPISLLEFGLYAKSGKLKVVVDQAFWRKGNIDIVCQKYNIEQFQTIDEILKYFINLEKIK